VTVPFPVPLLPDVTVMNESLLAAVQMHALPAVTSTVEVPPLAPTLTLVADNANVHGDTVLNVPTAENAVVIVPFVARTRQKYVMPATSGRGTTMLVVPAP
jgi:hypothetical protein